ncbi:M15 family metallopeptidase [Lachnospiraceae bacterium 46-15]
MKKDTENIRMLTICFCAGMALTLSGCRAESGEASGTEVISAALPKALETEKAESQETREMAERKPGETEEKEAEESIEQDTDGAEYIFQLEETMRKENAETPEKDVFVRVQDYIPEIFVELRYASAENFTGNVVYSFSDAYLRYGTVEKLAAVWQTVSGDGYSLKIWDAFRPVAAQFKLWEICPNAAYVANPNTGYSSHSRGDTVDITLVYQDGTEVEMPTGFDDFSTQADRDYSDCAKGVAENARYLERVMEENGFEPYFGEWWHFSDTDSYAVEEEFMPQADCEE